MDLDKYRTDKVKEQEGVWIPIDKTTKLLIARAFTKKYAERFRQETRPYKFQMESPDGLDEDTAIEVMARVLADTVLLGWEGLTLNGAEVTYSKEKAYELLSDSRYSEFAKMVDSISKDTANFRELSIRESEKKSESISDGT